MGRRPRRDIPDRRGTPPSAGTAGPGCALPSPARPPIRLLSDLVGRRTPDLDQDTAEDVVLAVDEAVGNAGEHGFRDGTDGVVGLGLSRSVDGGLEVVVADDGIWRPVPEDPGFRGRGLQLIHRLPDQASICQTVHGTTVRMRWRASTRP